MLVNVTKHKMSKDSDKISGFCDKKGEKKKDKNAREMKRLFQGETTTQKMLSKLLYNEYEVMMMVMKKSI